MERGVLHHVASLHTVDTSRVRTEPESRKLLTTKSSSRLQDVFIDLLTAPDTRRQYVRLKTWRTQC
eukprot:957384-Amphidinium_carterae.1